jgi:hypothetical protein
MEFAIQYELLNDDVAIPLSSLDNVVVWVYNADGSILRKFAMSALADHDTANFNIIDDAGGKFQVVLTAAITKDAKTGDYKAEMKYKLTTSGFVTVCDVKVFTFEASKTAQLTL